MTVSLIGLGLFSIVFLIILGIVSNSSEQSQENIQNKMFLINCPPPAYNSEWNATNVTIRGFAVVLNDTAGVASGGLGTVFRCIITPLSAFPAFQVDMSNKDYQEVTLGFPSGWFKYIGDYIGSQFKSVTELFQLIGFFVTPTNFNILGLTIANLGGVALMLVVATYAFCYIFIGILLYKVISPFSGAG